VEEVTFFLVDHDIVRMSVTKSEYIASHAIPSSWFAEYTSDPLEPFIKSKHEALINRKDSTLDYVTLVLGNLAIVQLRVVSDFFNAGVLWKLTELFILTRDLSDDFFDKEVVDRGVRERVHQRLLVVVLNVSESHWVEIEL